jgi:hypothetical protein
VSLCSDFITLASAGGYSVPTACTLNFTLCTVSSRKFSSCTIFTWCNFHQLFCFYSFRILCPPKHSKSFIKSSSTGVCSTFGLNTVDTHFKRQQRNNLTAWRASAPCSLRRNMQYYKSNIVCTVLGAILP